MMTAIVILDDASQLTSEQQKHVLNLHYSFLNFQRSVLEANHPIPDLRLSQLFSGNRIGVAMNNGTPVGYCIYRVIAGVLKIRSLYVVEQFRRNGLMSDLLNHIRQNTTFWQAQLTIHKNCTAGREFFASRGYQAKADGDWLQLVFFVPVTTEESPAALTA